MSVSENGIKTAMQRLIDERSEAQPVAWRMDYADGSRRYTESVADVAMSKVAMNGAAATPLYAHPPAAPTVQDAARVPEIAALIEAVSALGLRQLVAGWNGEGADRKYPPHEAALWAKITTTCGAVYAIDAAMQAIAGCEV